MKRTTEGKSDRWWQVYCAALGGLTSDVPARSARNVVKNAAYVADETMIAHGTKEETRNAEAHHDSE